MQAAILDLYDPDRSQEPLFGGIPRAGATSTARWCAGACVAAEPGRGAPDPDWPDPSPTLLRQIAELKRALPQMRVHVFDPLSGYGAQPQQRLRPNIANAEVVVSLDDDLLGPGPSQATNARAWGDRHGDLDVSRRIRLLMAETTPTQTGANADRRLGIPPSRLAMLAKAIVGGGEVTLAEAELAWAKEARQALEGGARPVPADGRPVRPARAPRGRASGEPGARQYRTACELAPPLGFVPGPGNSFLDLISDIEARRVAALFVICANPVYQAPGDIPFASVFAKVPLRVHAGLHVDETAATSNWHLPLNHALKDWSDARSPGRPGDDHPAGCSPDVRQPLGPRDRRGAHRRRSAARARAPAADVGAAARRRSCVGGCVEDRVRGDADGCDHGPARIVSRRGPASSKG